MVYSTSKEQSRLEIINTVSQIPKGEIAVITGEFRSWRLELIKILGWGRMFINMKPDPYPGEPWGFDNGAFRYWKMGIEFPMESYRKKLTRAYSIGIPVLSAIPDKLGDHKTSYEMALYFLQSNNLTQWPWYFCLQDGASFQDVGNLTASISGLFLGGSNKWKEEHAKEWCDYAHEHNLKFHYGRCSTPRKLRHAKEIGADSVDSAFILWTTDRFIQFAREWGK